MGRGASKQRLPPLKQGQIDIDQYRITVYPNIGVGAFGYVCEGLDKKKRTPIAAKGIKVLIGGQTYADLEDMAISESEKMKAVDHHNIVKLFNFCRHEDTF